MVVAAGWWLFRTYRENVEAKNLNSNFSFLEQPAGFPIASSSFRQTQRMQDAIFEGFLNTLRLSVTGIVLATILGTLIGIGRLSQNFIVRSAARAYVEIIRNVPLLAHRHPGLHRRGAERVPGTERRRGSSARSP